MNRVRTVAQTLPIDTAAPAMAAAAAAAVLPQFEVADDTYTEDGGGGGRGAAVKVKVLRNNATGEFVEVMVDGQGGGCNGLLLRSKKSGELRAVHPHRSGCVGTVMAPFANRVKDGAYSFGGQTHLLNDGKSHACHGLLKPELEVTAASGGASSCSVTMSATFDGSDPGYPFAVAVSFTYTMGADGLTVSVAAKNISSGPGAGVPAGPCPFMVGWHPWFCVSEVATAELVFDEVGPPPPLPLLSLQLRRSQTEKVDLPTKPATQHY
eukprot:SAG22_NODE_1631_length_3936_cov_2.342716_5_plen_266_part_00